MVDIERRKKLAFHLRQFSVGLTSNDDFEVSMMEDITDGSLPEQFHRYSDPLIDDPVILPIVEHSWCLYDDTKNHKLKGRYQLNQEALKTIARWILFLRSDQEYKWPYLDPLSPVMRFSLTDIIKTILSLGQHYRNKRIDKEVEFINWKALGNYDYWPFFSEEEYSRQLQQPPFLAAAK